MNYAITIGEDTYDIDAPDESTLRKAIDRLKLQVGTERSVAAAQTGAERRSEPLTLERMQRESLEDETQDQRMRRLMQEGEARGADIAMKGAPAALAMTALPEFAPGIAAWMGTPVGGAITSGGATALRGGSPEEIIRNTAIGAAGGPILGAGFNKAAKLIPFLLRLKTAAPATVAAAEASAPAFATSTGAAAPPAMIPNVTFSAPATAAARVPSSVVPFAAPPVTAPIAAAAPAVGRAGSQFQLGTAELARMLGQTEAAAAPAVAPILTATAPAVAPVVAAAAPAAAPAVAGTGLAQTVRPGYETYQIAERLRGIADTSAANKAAVMEGIKQDYAAYGFPTWQKMRDFVFKAEATIPSAQAVAEAEAIASQTAASRAALAPSVQPGYEAPQMANRLREIADLSGKNRAVALQEIKQRYAEFGFPSPQAMIRYVFKGQQTMPSTYTP